MTSTLTAAQIRRELGHPIVDADGHFMELGPLLNEAEARRAPALPARGALPFADLEAEIDPPRGRALSGFAAASHGLSA